MTKVNIVIDGDEGVNINTCASFSRRLAFWIEENEVIIDAFNLVVTTPGAASPLILLRQYKKHIGRTLAITTNEGRELEGEFLEITEENIIVVEVEGKKKKDPVELVNLPFDSIKTTEVVISFK